MEYLAKSVGINKNANRQIMMVKLRRENVFE